MGNAIVNDMVGEAVSQPTNEEQQRRERLAALAAMRVASGTEVPAEEPTLTVDGVGVFALGDIHGLKGKQKCGKTTMLKVCHLKRASIANFISRNIGESFIEENGMIRATDDAALAF